MQTGVRWVYLNSSNKLAQFKSIANIEEIVKFVSKKRPVSNELIDQCPITNKDLIQRVNLIYKYLPPSENRKILFIGDDDLTSAVIGNTSLLDLSVVDIDKNILSTIKNCIKKKQINLINLNILDVIDGKISDSLSNKFDAFVTDPPYTEMGYKYFLTYGLRHIKMEGFAFVAVPYMNEEDWTDELLFKVEDFLIQNGFVIIEIIPGFAEYQHDDKVISTMLIAKKVTVSKPTKNNLRRAKTYTTGFEL